MWPGATSPTWLPLYLIYFPGQGPQELPQDQQNIKEQDPEVVHSLDFVNDRLWLCDLEKIVLPLWASSVNYRCSWNYFLKMVLGVNFLKIAVKLIWASRLVAEKELKDYLDCGIIYFEGYFYFVGAKKWLSNFEFSSNIVCRKCFLLGVQRSRDWLPFYQLYCIFFTTCRSWNLWNFLSATQVKCPLTVCVNYLYFIDGGFFLILQVEYVCIGIIFTFKGTKFPFKGTLIIPESSQTFATFKEWLSPWLWDVNLVKVLSFYDRITSRNVTTSLVPVTISWW